MAVLVIPTPNDQPYYSQKVRLDGRDYLFHVAYNEREDRRYLSIHDEEDEPLVSGIKIIANWPLLRSYRFEPRLPPGELMAIDLTGDDSPPGLNELGEDRRVELNYFEADAEE